MTVVGKSFRGSSTARAARSPTAGVFGDALCILHPRSLPTWGLNELPREAHGLAGLALSSRMQRSTSITSARQPHLYGRLNLFYM